MIGLLKGTVRLADHSESWKEYYEAEEKLLRTLVNEWIIDIQHVGSTSVEGLSAKPIIDIALAVRDLGEVSQLMEPLMTGGFVHVPDASTEERIFFHKGTEEVRTHHLHVVEHGGNEWRTLTGFRDYLRNHPEAVAEYQALKKELAQRYATDRVAYTSSKNDFIQGILKRLG